MYAIENGHNDVAKLLLEHDVDLNEIVPVRNYRSRLTAIYFLINDDY
jgi:hypothetical protein